MSRYHGPGKGFTHGFRERGVVELNEKKKRLQVCLVHDGEAG